MTPSPSPVVSQEAREAAADYMAHFGGDAEVLQSFRDGRQDDMPIVVFMQRAIDATTKAERERIVAFLRAEAAECLEDGKLVNSGAAQERDALLSVANDIARNKFAPPAKEPKA